jgi:hypothetical protein
VGPGGGGGGGGSEEASDSDDESTDSLGGDVPEEDPAAEAWAKIDPQCVLLAWARLFWVFEFLSGFFRAEGFFQKPSPTLISPLLA